VKCLLMTYFGHKSFAWSRLIATLRSRLGGAVTLTLSLFTTAWARTSLSLMGMAWIGGTFVCFLSA